MYIRYVLPVLWMTSCFHIMEPVGQNQGQHYVWFSLPGGSTRDEAAVYNCRFVGINAVAVDVFCCAVGK